MVMRLADSRVILVSVESENARREVAARWRWQVGGNGDDEAKTKPRAKGGARRGTLDIKQGKEDAHVACGLALGHSDARFAQYLAV